MNKTTQPTLYFVYNANSGVLNGLVDFAHKIFSPDTYQCRLCQVTFGNTGMKGKWKTFIESLDASVIFLHKDELQRQLPDQTSIALPAVLLNSRDKIEQLISAREMNQVKDLDNFIKLVNNRMKQLKKESK